MKSPKMKNGIILRGRIWWVCYRHAGKTVWESTGSTERKDAVALRESKRTESRRGTLVPDAARVTFEDLKLWFEEAATANGNKSRPKWKQLDAWFAGTRALDVAARVGAFEAARLKAGAARATVNQELAGLRRMFRLAVERKALSRDHVPVIHTPDPHNARQNFYTERQVKAVETALPACYRPVWRFMYLTAWRINEVLPLAWAQVDWSAGCLRLATSKNGEARQVNFIKYGPLLDLLREMHRRADGPMVFHDRGRALSYWRWNPARKRAVKAAGVPDGTAHDMRRVAVRNMERAGVSRSVAMSISGHKTESTYRRYAIADATAQDEAGAKLTRAFASAPRSADVLDVTPRLRNRQRAAHA